MKWDNLREIGDYFELPPELETVQEIRRELRKQLLDVHPDKWGGVFPDRVTEDRYHQLTSALEYLDSEPPRGTALARMEDLNALLVTLEGRAHEQRVTAETQTHRLIRQRYAIPKITSATFAAVTMFVFTLLGSFERHPMYQSIHDGFSRRARIEARTLDVADSIKNQYFNLSGELYRWAARRDSLGPRLLVWLDSIPEVGSQGDSAEVALTTLHSSISFVLRHMNGDVLAHESPSRQWVFDLVELQDRANEARYEYKRARVADEQRIRVKIQLLIMLCLVGSISAFLATWLRERSDERWIDFIGTEDGLGYVFRHLEAQSMKTASQHVTIGHITILLERKQVSKLLGILVGTHLDPLAARKLAPSVLERLLSYGAMTKEPTSGFFPSYRVRLDLRH
jgi:hypothetical protein